MNEQNGQLLRELLVQIAFDNRRDYIRCKGRSKLRWIDDVKRTGDRMIWKSVSREVEVKL